MIVDRRTSNIFATADEVARLKDFMRLAKTDETANTLKEILGIGHSFDGFAIHVVTDEQLALIDFGLPWKQVLGVQPYRPEVDERFKRDRDRWVRHEQVKRFLDAAPIRVTGID